MGLLARSPRLLASTRRGLTLTTGSDHEPGLDSFKLIATGLYKLGIQRLADGKTSTNIYSHFREPTSPPFTSPGPPPSVLGTLAASGHLEAFQHLHQIVLNFGSPEVADQMSGNMYMHASMVEDECSKCLHLTERVRDFSINDLKAAVTCLTWWGSDARNSLPLRDLVEALDRVSVDRLHSLHFTLEDQLRLAFQWRSLEFRPEAPLQFPAKVVEAASPFALQSSLPVLLSCLLLLSTDTRTSLSLLPGEKVTEKLTPILEYLAESEVAAGCQGLRSLEGGEEGAALLSSVLAQKWGYRM